MSNYLRAKCAELVDGRSLAQLIVVSKNQQRPTISTSQHPGCGGYSSDFVYKIELKEFLSQFSRYAERSLYLTELA